MIYSQAQFVFIPEIALYTENVQLCQQPLVIDDLCLNFIRLWASDGGIVACNDCKVPSYCKTFKQPFEKRSKNRVLNADSVMYGCKVRYLSIFRQGVTE